MAAIEVGTTAVLLPVSQGMVQNKGPGVVYVGGGSNVATTTGIEVPVGAAIVLGRALTVNRWWAVSDTAETDVRVHDGVLSMVLAPAAEAPAEEPTTP